MEDLAKLNNSQRSAMRNMFPGGVDSVAVFAENKSCVRVETVLDGQRKVTWLGARGAVRASKYVI